MDLGIPDHYGQPRAKWGENNRYFIANETLYQLSYTPIEDVRIEGIDGQIVNRDFPAAGKTPSLLNPRASLCIGQR